MKLEKWQEEVKKQAIQYGEWIDNDSISKDGRISHTVNEGLRQGKIYCFAIWEKDINND